MKRSYRVLHVITELGDGGAEASLYRLCTQAHDVEHHVISLMDEGKYGGLLRDAGIAVTSLNMPRGRVTLSGMRLMWRHMRALGPDAVQTWMYHADLLGGIAARLSGVRNITWGVHNSVLVPGQNSATTILVARICARLSHVVPHTIICCARKAANVHAKMGYRSSIMRVVPNGYDLTQFQPSLDQRQAVRFELELEDQDVIGFVARYDHAKDHENLLQALALLRHRNEFPRCLLIGTGMESSNTKLVERVAHHGVGDQVMLMGRRNDVPAIMNALDIHVLSSSSEAFPNVLAEAMACGTPCVSTDVGDAADIVGDSGWIAPPGDPSALADAIQIALAARRRRDWPMRCNKAREWIAQSFSIDRMVQGYQQVWHGNGHKTHEP